MHAHTVIALAEIRHAELLAHAEQLRQTRRAGAPRRGWTPWGRGFRHGLTALGARMSAAPRPSPITSTDLAPATAETT